MNKKILDIIILSALVVFISGEVFAKDITITSPTNNAIVYQGDIITINVQVSNPIKLASLLLVTPGGVKEFSKPPYNYTITIPDKLGDFGIVAAGKTITGDLISDSISIIVKTHAILESIKVDPEEFYLEYPEDKLMISVLGKYANGKIEYLNSANVGLRFISDNNSIAIVDSQGEVTAKGDGQCTITVSLEEKSQKVRVNVKAPVDSIKAKINLQPKILDVKSEEYLSCYIELPKGFSPKDVDAQSISLNYQINAAPGLKTIIDYNKNGIPELLIKFPTKSISYYAGFGDKVHIIICGEIKGKYFRGTEFIKVIDCDRSH